MGTQERAVIDLLHWSPRRGCTGDDEGREAAKARGMLGVGVCGLPCFCEAEPREERGEGFWSEESGEE